MSELYEVKFIDQDNGDVITWNVVADDLQQIDDDFADIKQIRRIIDPPLHILAKQTKD